MAVHNLAQHMPPKLKQTNSFAIQIVYDSLKSKIAYPGAGSWGQASPGGGGIHWVAFVCWKDQAGGPHYAAWSLCSQMTHEVILKLYLPLAWNWELVLSFG